jgi:D-alanyl-D-alanine carboxypeptidase (penicillin-binding protein 5/6)
MKKIFIMGFIFLSSLIPVVKPKENIGGTLPPLVELKSVKSAVLMEVETNQILYQFNAHEKRAPASMTKIMTMIVAIESVENLDAVFTFEKYVIDALISQGASRAGFEAGEGVTIRDMLYGAALPSGGDATAGLAIYVSGSERLFAEKMNDKAAELGLKNTHFVNASGLHHDNHYTTLSDMTAIFAYALQNETFVEIISAKSYTTSSTDKHPDGIKLYSSLFSRAGDVSLPGEANIICGKTGYTDEAKHCLITLSENKITGKKYIIVTAKGSYTTFLPGGSTDGIYQPLYDLAAVYNKYLR